MKKKEKGGTLATKKKKGKKRRVGSLERASLEHRTSPTIRGERKDQFQLVRKRKKRAYKKNV